MNLRRYCVVLAFAAFVVAGGSEALATLQQQRDQIAVNVLVNVTPAPVGYNGAGPRIALGMTMRARGSAIFDAFQTSDQTPIRIGGRTHLAFQTAQSALRVQAMVSPNPNATLLYYNNPQVVINQQAGTTASYSCAYTITVDKTISPAWNLYDGLSNDFSGMSFPGKDLANNTYLQGAHPNPTATPFIVYPDNNNNWYKRASATTAATYCIDLTLTIPSSVPGGAYSTNAVYTIYF
ncbi:MAG TPA: hypothetical protein VGZ02_15275 [Candidatus Baltobacteraceae bacterium]|jgi:hypothetical protein|nr:hypothetical protein [Candidatus Baltobacteraceae bacterium]